MRSSRSSSSCARSLVAGLLVVSTLGTAGVLGCGRRDKGPAEPTATHQPQTTPSDEGLGTGGAMDTMPQQAPDAVPPPTTP